MSIRTSIILLVSLAMVAGYVFFVQSRQTEEAKDEPPWFFSVDMADMTRITLTDHGNEAVFSLGNDTHWHIGEASGLPVSLDRWGGITLLLGGPKSLRLLEEEPADLEPYGLDSPQTEFLVGLKDGRSIRIFMGLPTPDAVGTYAQVQGFPDVFTISKEWGDVLTNLIAKPPYPEWYYDILPSQITSLKLQTQKNTIAMIEGEDGWNFDNEAKSPVEETYLTAVMNALAQPTQSLVEYDVDDLAKYGLDVPSALLQLQVERLDDEGYMVISNYRFRIGNPTEDGTGYYVQVERGDTLLPDVIKVNASWVEGLENVAANPPDIDVPPQGS